MSVFQAVFGELKGVLGKAYLLAGLVPALLFVVGWRWYASEGGLQEVLETQVRAFTGEAVGEALTTVIGALAIGLVFYAVRAQVVAFLQALPGRPLAPLRFALERRQQVKRRRVEREAAEYAHLLTVTKWLAEGDLPQPKSLPPGEPVPSAADVAETSADARSVLSKLSGKAGPPPPSRRQTDVLLRGARQLYALAKTTPADPTCVAEIAAWKTLLVEPDVQVFLRKRPKRKNPEGYLWGSVYRRWAAARIRLDSFPDEEWLRPTALGTRSSALDDYAKRRYRIDTSSMLARLWGTLDQDERNRLGDARLAIEVLVNVAVALFFLALLVVGSGGRDTIAAWAAPAPDTLPRLDLRTVSFLLTAILGAYLFYRASVWALAAYAEQVVRVVDLRRLKLFEGLGFERPETVGEERELWAELQTFFNDAHGLDPDRPLEAASK